MGAVVLGGTGFIGRHVCRAFAGAGLDVLAIARRPERLPHRMLPADLLALPTAAVTELLVAEQAGVVVNAAGAVWQGSDDEMARLNGDLVRHLLDAVAAMPWRPRLVQLGSTHEYGPLPVGTYIDETTPPRPTSSYGRTKLTGSRAVIAAARAGRVDGVVLRVSNAVGPGTPGASLLGRVSGQLAEAAGHGRPAVLRLAPLHDQRDFVDVDDVADAVLASAAAPCTGQVINIGSGRATGVRHLVELLVTISGVPADVVEVERPPTGPEPARGTGVQWQVVDIATAVHVLGWVPKRSTEESLRALWTDVVNRRSRKA